MRKEIIFESLSIRIVAQFVESVELKSSKLCFSFYGRGVGCRNGEGLDEAWGGNFLVSEGFYVIGFIPLGANWYQDLNSEGLLEIIRCHVKNNLQAELIQIVSYGSSMGGYAALKFSAVLGCTHVLSLSPVTYIKSDLTPAFNNDLVNEISTVDFKDINPSSRVLICYDPFSYDLNFINGLRKDISCSFVEFLAVKHSGHPSTVVLQDTGYLKKIFRLWVSNCSVAAPPLSAKVNSKTYVDHYLRHLIRSRKYYTAYRLVKRSKALIFQDDKLFGFARGVAKKVGSDRLSEIFKMMDF